MQMRPNMPHYKSSLIRIEYKSGGKSSLIRIAYKSGGCTPDWSMSERPIWSALHSKPLQRTDLDVVQLFQQLLSKLINNQFWPATQAFQGKAAQSRGDTQ